MAKLIPLSNKKTHISINHYKENDYPFTPYCYFFKFLYHLESILVGDCVTLGEKKFFMIYPNAPAAAVTPNAFQSIVNVPAFKDEYKTESGVVKAATSKPLRKSAALSEY